MSGPAKENFITESAISITIRYAVYTGVICFLAAGLPYLLHDNTMLFSENGLVEWLEVALASAVSAAALWGVFAAVPFRWVMFLLSAVAFLAACREMDMILDAIIPLIGWKIGYGAVIFAIWRLYTHRHELKPQITRFLGSRAFALLWAGFILMMPVAQLIGSAQFLKQLMGDDYIRDYRRAIQETSELIGYLLLLAGVIEGIMRARAERAKSEHRKPAEAFPKDKLWHSSWHIKPVEKQKTN